MAETSTPGPKTQPTQAALNRRGRMKGPDTIGCMRTRQRLRGLCPCQKLLLHVCVHMDISPICICVCLDMFVCVFCPVAALARCVSSVIPCPWATDQSSHADSLPAGVGLIKELQTDPGSVIKTHPFRLKQAFLIKLLCCKRKTPLHEETHPVSPRTSVRTLQTLKQREKSSHGAA